jgi:hypothetical protein
MLLVLLPLLLPRLVAVRYAGEEAAVDVVAAACAR